MLVRIVKMTFHPEHIPAFLEVFEENKERIRASEGCTLVELYQDQQHKNLFFTYSYWEAESYLEKYRNSEFFKSVWSKTNPLFSEKPAAWSVHKLHSLP